MKKHEPPPGFATISAYARHRGVHRSYIGRLVEKGLLPHTVTPRGVNLIDIAKADAILNDMPATDELRGGAGEKQQTAYAQARLVKMVFDAKLAKLEYERASARMVDAEAVRARLARNIATITERMDEMIDRLAPRIAREPDRRKVHKLLGDEIRRQLVEIAGIVGGRQQQGGEDDRKTHDVPVP